LPPILLDTNILVYTFDPRDAARQEKAFTILLKLEEQGLGCTSTQCLSEFVNVMIAKQRMQMDDVIRKVDEWRSIFPVFNLTPLVILEAARGVRDHQLAYYDAQIWAAARLNHVSVIFSEDFQDGQTIEGVRFVNPFAESFDIQEWI
jgi:predicted nucleic acid-binding protein